MFTYVVTSWITNRRSSAFSVTPPSVRFSRNPLIHYATIRQGVLAMIERCHHEFFAVDFNLSLAQNHPDSLWIEHDA